MLEENYFINFEEYHVFKHFPERLNEANGNKGGYKIINLFGFMDDNHFVAEIVSQKQRKY